MQPVVQVFVNLVLIIISILELLILVRAITSWFPLDDDSPLLNFLYLATEPILAPIRALLELIPFMRNLPIDASTLVAYLLLTILSAFLPEVRF